MVREIRSSVGTGQAMTKESVFVTRESDNRLRPFLADLLFLAVYCSMNNVLIIKS